MVNRLKESLRSEVDSIIRELDGGTVAGCCEPTLNGLEAQVASLPWPADADAESARDRLIDAIRRAREKARRGNDHLRW